MVQSSSIHHNMGQHIYLLYWLVQSIDEQKCWKVSVLQSDHDVMPQSPMNVKALPSTQSLQTLPHLHIMTTMTHLANPIVDQLEAMWHIWTCHHPAGTLIHVFYVESVVFLRFPRQWVLWVSGFACVSSNNFCLFFMLQLHDIEVLDSNLWRYWEEVDVISNATLWMKAMTKKDHVGVEKDRARR
jgi:hypothetical protein